MGLLRLGAGSLPAVTGRRITRLLGLLVVLLGLAVAPATGAGAHGRVHAPATHDAQASPSRRTDDSLASTMPRAGASCSLSGRRADLGHVPLVADLASGSSAPGNHPGRRIAVEPGSALHESSALARCGRGPPAA
jgi:hypothetical protein